MKAKLIFLTFLVALLTSSCSEYQKLLKSSDSDLKFAKAKEYYQKGDYLQSCTLLESVVVSLRGTLKGEEALFLLANGYYLNKDNITAKSYFSGYLRSYPRGTYAEESAFKVGMCYYNDSPEAKLDQAGSVKAIAEFSSFIQTFPGSIYAAEAQSKRQELRDKLAYKAYLNSKLYFRLGNYQGNNYKACVISATNAIREYPESIYREELAFLILKAKFKEAEESVASKQGLRYADAAEEYQNFIQEYPESSHAKEAAKILEVSKKHASEE